MSTTATTTITSNTTSCTLEQLVNIGGKLWEKNGVRRVYFNDLWELFGLEIDLFGTGNVRNAWLHGEKISNSYANKIIGDLDSMKLWVDLTDFSIRTSIAYRPTIDYSYERILSKALLEMISAV